MKKVLVFRHVPHESLGTLEPFLNSLKIAVEYCDLFRHSSVPKDPKLYSLIISMGGPMNADETDRFPFLASERLLIKQAIDLNQSVIGICLGSQIIARALGAKVYRGPQKEIGWHSINVTQAGSKDPVFGMISEKKLVVFHWHGDTFELPKGAVHLASSDLYPNQAFRFHQNVYALQFHVEITAEIILEWINQNKNELAETKPAVTKEMLIQDTSKYMGKLSEITDKIYPALFSNLIGSEVYAS